jgi:cobyrinic acid a,c-diamide synthase
VPRLHSIVVAGTHSGVGKTSVTLGLIGALRRRGLVVQPFKVGPDFIDPSHHARAAGRAAHNLDGWMLPRESNLQLFDLHTADADVAVVEGVMGLFDGSDPRAETGSAAEMAKWLGAPVVLVIDASAMARSAAAIVHGYATFDPELRVAGVIANRVGSEGHAGLIAAALEGGPPLLGWFASTAAFAIPERHLGLHLPRAADSDSQRDALAEAAERTFDLEALLALSRTPPPPATRAEREARQPLRARIGIARDEAFAFYYEDNLSLLEAAGAELVDFSPLRDPLPEGLDGLYIGGGYPEVYAPELEANAATRTAVRAFAEAGRPVYAECGGLMYLGQELRLDGSRHEMCGVFPIATEFPGPLEISYCEITATAGPLGSGNVARGHWFHNAKASASGEVPHAHDAELPSGKRLREGYSAGNAIGSWVHLHFRSCPAIADAFVSAAARRSPTPSAPPPPPASPPGS